MFGSHLSIAGGLHNALIEAQTLGLASVQIFTKNQRQWKVKPLAGEQVALWQQHRKSSGLSQVVSHDSYLINLASPSREVFEKSLALFRDELLRCEELAIPFLVTHPGAHLGSGEETGLRKVADALSQLHAELKGLKTITCLEITAGQGTGLGYRLEHLRTIIEQTREPQRLGVCLDTAHLLAAGYDLTSSAGAKAVLAEVQSVLGLDRVKVWHLNDSKVPLGKRVDRHEHWGKGHVSLDALRQIVRDRRCQGKPMILETPKGTAPNGKPWDAINLAVLRKLAGAKSTRKK